MFPSPLEGGPPGQDRAVLWRPPLAGVEVLHARFRRHVYARHAHEALTLALVDAGAAAFTCGGRDYLAPSGTAFMIRPGEPHTGSPATPAGYRYRVLYIEPRTLGELLGPPGSAGATSTRLPASGTLRDPRLIRSLARAHDALGSRASSLARDSALLEVGRALAEHGAEHGGPVAEVPRVARIARDYLHAHPDADVSLKQLSQICGVGVHHLIRSFSAAMGMPPHAYQTQLRVWRARALLFEGLQAAEVALRTGFYDQAHFTRVFKRYTGVTPGQFLPSASAAPASLATASRRTSSRLQKANRASHRGLS